jgi:hypothetical protein
MPDDDLILTDREMLQIRQQRAAQQVVARDIPRQNLLASLAEMNDEQLCRPYPPIRGTITKAELDDIKTIQEVGRTMIGAHGMPVVTHIQPSLALAISRALRGKL